MNLISNKKDEKITFDEKTHSYFINGKKVDYSVTEFIHQFFPKFNPDEIIEKFYDIWQTNPNSPYFNISKEEIKQIWNDNGKQASELGTKLHKNIEKFYNGEEINDESTEYSYFKNFYNDFRHLKPLRQEWIVFDEELSIAGSIDAIFQNEDEIIIIDWKRSKEIKEQSRENGFYPLSHLPNANYWHYSLQLNIYKYILEKNYNLKINGLNLVVMHPNQDNYQIIKIQNLKEEIDNLFKLRLKELNSI